jgi:hypothetical protein
MWNLTGWENLLAHLDSQVITSLTALAAVFVGPIAAIYVARRQIRASLVSANRQAWVDELRSALADSLAKQTTWTFHADPKLKPDLHVFAAKLEESERLLRQVELLLDPDNAVHAKLIMAVSDVSADLFDFYEIWEKGQDDTAKAVEIRNKQRTAIEIAQQIFKFERERIKRGE